MNLHNFDKRLGNIEKTLTPQQVVGFLMDKAFKVRATEDYASWRQEDVVGLINRTLTGVIERTSNDGSKFQAHAFARARTELSKLISCWVGCDRFASGIIGNGLRGIGLLLSESLRMVELARESRCHRERSETFWRARLTASTPMTPPPWMRPITTWRTGTVWPRERCSSGWRPMLVRKNVVPSATIATTSTPLS